MIARYRHAGYLIIALSISLLWASRCSAQYGSGIRLVWNPATGRYEEVSYNPYTGAPAGYGYTGGAYGAYGYQRSAYGAYGSRTGYNPYTDRYGSAAAGYNAATGSRGAVAGGYNPYTGGPM